MKLKEKREVVRKFKAGDSLVRIMAGEIERREGFDHIDIAVSVMRKAEDTIRDYINGRFTLEPKGKRKV